jgi:HD superfamily phosphohydrolase
LRLAALLHDGGHFPFSHQFETADTVRKMLEDSSLFEALWSGEDWKSYYEDVPNPLKHEHYSVRVAHEILKGLHSLPEIDPKDVLGMMETTSSRMSDRFNGASHQVLGLLLRDQNELKGIKETKAGEVFKAFFQTIISGELDIDKMDYLLRDSFYSGCKYGMYNLDHLLNTLRIGFTKKPHWVGLAVTEKGIGAFEDFVHSRFQLYQQVYSHKTVVGFKWLLNTAMNDVLKQVETKKEVRNAITHMREFQHFTDMFFWERFRKFSGNRPESAADRLIRRRPLKFLQSGEDFSSFKKSQTVEHLKATLRQQSPSRSMRPEVIVYESPIKFSKVSHPSFEKVRVLVRIPITKKRSLEEIKEKSKFFDKFHDIEITHFYIRPSLEPDPNVTKHRAQRSRSARGSDRA